MTPYRIAVITTHDTLWSLTTWTRALPRLIVEGHEVVGFFTCNDKMGANTGDDIYQSYIRIFGRCNYFVLGIFGLCVRLMQIFLRKPQSFQSLCKLHSIPYKHVASINDDKLVDWMRENGIDIILVTVSQIIKKPLIDAVRCAIINRHPGVLPDNRGTFPYVWACLNKLPQGITYHRVNEKIDAGNVIYKRIVDDKRAASSMLSYDIHVAASYADDICFVLQEFNNSKTAASDGVYYGLPNAEDVKNLIENGFYINRLRDFCGIRMLFN